MRARANLLRGATLIGKNFPARYKNYTVHLLFLGPLSGY